MTFQLDTSGAVHAVTASDGDLMAVLWSDLTPFTQGYIEALFAGPTGNGWLDVFRKATSMYRPAGFSDLAPETLARIIADCASFGNEPGRRGVPMSAAAGAVFWRGRQASAVPGFPPLAVSLGDDGKVYAKAKGDAE